MKTKTKFAPIKDTMDETTKDTTKADAQPTTQELLGFSQNFLNSGELIKELVKDAGIEDTDYVIDIGAGRGKITEVLSKTAKKVTAIEIDEKLVEHLKDRFKDYDNVEVLGMDFLTYTLPTHPFKIFANIPFNLSAEIMRKITHPKSQLTQASLLVQEEVARRFIGAPHVQNTQVAMILKTFYELDIVFEFTPSDFQPRPNINIVLLDIEKRDIPLVPFKQRREYVDFITYTFNQWSPTVLKAWDKLFTNSQLNRFVKDVKINRKAKPSWLSPEQYSHVFNYMMTTLTHKQKATIERFVKEHNKKNEKLEKRKRTIAKPITNKL